MALHIPNAAAATHSDQAAPDSTDVDALVLGQQQTGVITGCAVTQRAAGANMSVDVAAGTVIVAGTKVAVTAINKTIGAADATNPRWDLISVSNAGVVTVTAGTAAAIPAKPAIPATSAPLAAVYVPAAATSITTGEISDRQVVLPDLSVIYAPLTAQSRIPLRPLAPNSATPLGVKLRGGNIVTTPTETDTMGVGVNPGKWADLFSTWDWAGWIQPQIDRMTAIGGNCVRLMGDIAGVTDGTFTLATYLARWTQLLNYCRANRVYVYPTCINRRFLGAGNASETAIASHIQAHFALLAQYPDVVFAVDIDNELEATGFAGIGGRAWTTVLANYTTLLPALKASYPWISLGLSQGEVNSTYNAAIASLVDHWDIHWYTTPLVQDINTLISPTAKPIIVGEFGANQGETSAARVARYTAVRDNFATRPEVMGALAWSLAHDSATAATDWGLFDASNVLRTDIGNIWKTLPTQTSPWVWDLFPASDLTLPGTSAWQQWKASAAVQFGVPVRLRIALTVDLEAKAAAQRYTARVTIDGNEVNTTTPAHAFLGSDTSTSPQRATVAQVYRTMLLPGSHTINLEVAHATGTDATGVAYAAHSGLHIEAQPL